MSDDTLPDVKKRDLLDHSDEQPEPYQIKNIDLNLLNELSDKILNLMLFTKNLRPIDKSDALRVLGGIQGIGKEGEDFHDLSEQEQNGLMADMFYSDNLPQMSEKFMVALDYKPAQPAVGPTGPAFVPSFGPGGGGMRPTTPQPTPPGGIPPYYPQQLAYDPYGQPVYPPQYPPGNPPAGYPTYPPQPYPPVQGDPQQAGQQQGYAQPHPYPSYPVPPGQHPGYPPAGAPLHWPPQHPGAGNPYPPPAWPPQQPTIIEAEEVKDVPDAAGTDTQSET